MHPISRATGVLLLALVAALPALAQPRPGASELPITRVVLFSSGVGYFQRDGVVSGSSRIDLQFQTDNINDLIKSLVLQDTGGGRVSAVSYDSRDPIEKTLKSFAIDLTTNPSMGQLLGQVRGERVELVTYGETGREGQPVNLTGVVVGVQKQRRPVGKDQVIETEVLDLLTAEGLQSVALNQVQRVKFLRPELEQEFRRALEVLATGHDKQKKTVSLNFLGDGKRAVRVGYVTEAPVWKTSYRLAIDKDNKVFLQGWAVVENTTDDDWNQVALGLVSGRPISFRMNLYDPLYVTRPLVEPELFASLRPPSYSGSLDDKMARKSGEQRMAGARDRLGAMPRGGSGPAPAAPAPAAAAGEAAGLRMDAAGKGVDMQQGVASAAVATELGEHFQYLIEHPVSLPRQKSALLPIVNGPVEASKVSIYNETVHGKFPLHGLRLKNTTGLNLMQGPITVFEGQSYAGDARIPDLQPQETRLLSYAVDLGTEVAPEIKQSHESLIAARIEKGILWVSHKLRQVKQYTIKNRSEHERVVLLEHPYRPDWTLVTPEKPAERSRDVYRFEVKVAPGQSTVQEVVEEHTRQDQILLTNSDDDTIAVFLRANVVSPRVKAALQEALKLKGLLTQTQREIQQEQEALKSIEQDQARMRANMERVPPTSEAYKRYLKKFDDQETEIERRRATVAKLQQTAQQQRKAYESFLANLTVE